MGNKERQIEGFKKVARKTGADESDYALDRVIRKLGGKAQEGVSPCRHGTSPGAPQFAFVSMLSEVVMPAAPPQRSNSQAMRRGLFGRCPHCGEGKLFDGYLTVVQKCSACGEPLSVYRAADGPAFFTMSIVGLLLIPILDSDSSRSAQTP